MRMSPFIFEQAQVTFMPYGYGIILKDERRTSNIE